MSAWLVPIASFFVMWWIVLFAMLPWALGAREEEGEGRRLGTTEGAPHRPRMLRAVLFTTLVSIALMAAFYVVTGYFGYSFDDIPRVVPDFTDATGQ